MNDKKLGMLIGLHVGDCLGIPLEFTPPRPKDNWVTEITGGGAFNFPAGVGSDDTDLMLCILRSIAKKKKFDIADIAKNLVMWKHTNPPDIGNTTRFGIANIEKGERLDKCGLTDEFSQGNGSIMRCAPLALIPGLTYEDIVAQASLTHGHQNCIDTDNFFINLLTYTLDKYGEGMEIAAWFKDKSAIDYLSKCTKLKWEDLPTSGWCIHTLGAALWALKNFNNFEDALIAVVNRGDDADTTGAVTGALLGAYFGYKAIPKRWVDKLKSADEIKKLLEEIE